MTASSGQQTSLASNTGYNLFSLPTAATLGSGDSDTYTYDSNTGRMTQYNFDVNGSSVVGNLTWNSNGTLNQLAITDPFNSGNAQTCGYSYDDLARIATANCGSVWSQSFTFDPFSNLSKSGTISFQPTYNTSTNRVSQVGSVSPSYDANGDLENDGVQAYSWDSDGNSISAGSASLTFDALDRAVEMDKGGSYTQFVYSPTGGKLALMSGQSLTKAFVPLSGGATAVYNSSGLAYYRHTDWLGSSRLGSTTSRTVYYDGAYAPYGENYAETGTTDRSFAGVNQDILSSGPYPLYDGLYREYHPTWGRWLSPDPAGLGAVVPTNPQTWNRYAYVANNPLLLIDPLGLDASDNPGVCEDNPYDVECSGPGGGGGGGGGGGVGLGAGGFPFASLCPGDFEPCFTWQLPIFPVIGPWGWGSGGSGESGGTTLPEPTGPSGDDFITYNCLGPGILAQLRLALVSAAAAALGSTLSAGTPPAGVNPVQGGAYNVYINTPNSGAAGAVYIDPSVLAQSSSPNPLWEKGWSHQLIVPADADVPGPGMWVHVLFNAKATDAGILVTAAKVHADIANPKSGYGLGVLKHGIADVLIAAQDSAAQGGCAVKIF